MVMGGRIVGRVVDVALEVGEDDGELAEVGGTLRRSAVEVDGDAGAVVVDLELELGDRLVAELELGDELGGRLTITVAGGAGG